MTVDQAIKELQKLKKQGFGKALLVQSVDSEGNSFRNSCEFGEGFFRPESTWSGEFVSGKDQAEVNENQGEEYSVASHRKAVCLWPIN